MTTMSATSCAQPAAVIRTVPETTEPPPGTDRAGSPGRGRRCSRRSLGDAHPLTFRVGLGRGRSKLGVVRPDDAIAAPHQPDAQRKERNDQEHYPHVSHGSPRVRSCSLDVYAAIDSVRRGPDDLLTREPAGLTDHR